MNRQKKEIEKYDYEELDQYDYIDGDYIEKAADEYSTPIGLFLINFSILEQELNEAVADIISNRSHENGYVIIEKLTMSNKIELFYKLYLRLDFIMDKKNKEKLGKIRKELEDLNLMRNSIVHANWQTLTKDGYVRTKIVVDNQEGFVKFKKVKITTKIIYQKIKETEKLVNKIYKYKEKALQF